MRPSTRKAPHKKTIPTPPSNNLQLWIARVKNKEIPSFNAIIEDIISFTQEEACSASDLAQLILKDVSMTTKVLKLANSFYFNPHNIPVTTVSRAVIAIGFNTIKEISLAILLIDHLAKGSNRQHLIEELARSIHAATQAKALAELCHDTPIEEVFIQTLLHNIGDLIFWSVAKTEGEALTLLLAAPEYENKKNAAEIALLGFTLQQFGQRLNKEWNLSSPKDSDNPEQRHFTINTAYQIATIAEKFGWKSPEMQDLLKKIGEKTQLKPEKLITILRENASSAANIAGNLGMRLKRVIEIIPVPEDKIDWSDAREQLQPKKIASQTMANATTVIPSFGEPDLDLQLKVQREISDLIEHQAAFKPIMQLVLEGIHEGIGCDRALYAQLSSDGENLNAKSALGPHSKTFIKKFQFKHDNILFKLLAQKKPCLLNTESHSHLNSEIPEVLVEVIQHGDILLAPFIVNQQTLGLFYADRSIRQGHFDTECFENFCHLIKQTCMGLTLAALQANT
ncbi:MAG: HDOD domain-containing protein [Pseudomonadales bacterium]|nr:HDOD domain-containing protein [Pseudomonadales bacterium]